MSNLGIQVAQHGNILPDTQENYIIEKYIDDKYPRVSVDGYICGDQIKILGVVDSVYYKDDPLKFNYLVSHSVHDSSTLREKYMEIIKELKQVTKCDKQIIDVEFFIVEGKPIGMEINPRVFTNMIPVYTWMTGYNPWLVMEAIKKGHMPLKITAPCKTVISKYNHAYQHEPVFLQHDNSIFTIMFCSLSHTYGFSDNLNREQLLEVINRHSIST